MKGRPFYLSEAQIAWVEETLAGMRVQEKIGQLFCPMIRLENKKQLLHMVREVGIGGYMYRPASAQKCRKFNDFMQQSAKIPLLVGGNLEAGGNGALTDGTFFGNPMQVAAADNAELAYQLGKVSCGEAAAAGLNWAFAPVVDLDLNFRNPITNLRTFGSDPDRVTAMAGQYLKAAAECGVIATLKHFPGDGVDERDQHLVTSVNSLSKEAWDASYGKIYAALIAAGAKAVMAGHIALPAYQSDGGKIVPASQSEELLTGLLRKQLGFNGLITTDATPMGGYRSALPRAKALPQSIAAGADMILFVCDMQADFNYVLRGYEQGIISPERLDEAVTRILALKASLPFSEEKGSKKTFDAARWVRQLADESVTLAKDTQALLPISPEKHRRVYLNVLEDCDSPKSKLKTMLKQKLEARGFAVTLRERTGSQALNMVLSSDNVPLRRRVSALLRGRKAIKEIVENPQDFIARYDLAIVVAAYDTSLGSTDRRLHWQSFMATGNDLPWYAAELPTLFLSLGNPYHLLDVPMVKTFVNAYSNNESAIDAALDKLLGLSAFKGKSPVDITCGRSDLLL